MNTLFRYGLTATDEEVAAMTRTEREDRLVVVDLFGQHERISR